MVGVECVATQGFVTFISMPLLTELVSIKILAINMALLTELSPHASTSGVSGGDLPRDGSWGPTGGYSLNWHNQRGEILAPAFGP